MKAIIIAGGRGERLKPLTDTIPKVMIEMAGRPLLEYVIFLLKKYNIAEFILSLCYLPDKITSYFGDGSKFGVKIDYVFENQDAPLGTAGAIVGARKYIDDTFIVTYADILRELNIDGMLKVHKQNKAFVTLAVYQNKKTDPKSLIKFDRENRVYSFIERPQRKDLKKEKVWSNASFYICEPGIFDYLSYGVRSDFGKDIFPKIIKAGEKVCAYVSTEYFVDIGNRENLSYARRTFR